MHTAALRMYSKTSASVLALLFSTAPTAAARLGEIELFRSYLTLLEQLLAQAPRALRPLFEHLNLLLAQLTLGGLRRWALWGVAAHRTDYEAQAAYFALASPESQAVLQKERRGTLFVDVQRRLNIYLRALWGRDFWLRPTSGDFETRVEVPQMTSLLGGLQKVANRIFSGLVIAAIVIASAMLMDTWRSLGTIGFSIAGLIGLYMVVSILITDRRGTDS